MKRIFNIFLAILIISGLCIPMNVYAKEDVAAIEASTDKASLEATKETPNEKKNEATKEASNEASSEAAAEASTNEEEAGEDSDLNPKDEKKDAEIPKLSSIEDARKGVVQVNCVYKDDLGESHIIQGGTGFLIGFSEGTEYVITNNHIINPDKKTRDTAFKAIGVDKDKEWDKIGLTAQVVVEGDVVLDATVVKASTKRDFVVLQLEQPMYTRMPLTVLVAESKSGERPYSVADKIFTLGYPEGITYEDPVYYSNDKVSMTAGTIANLTSVDDSMVIQHDAMIDDSNCGGPLINEDGLVIGLNNLGDEGSANYSLESVEIAAILDGLGIKYSKMSAEEYIALKTPKELEVKADDFNIEPEAGQKRVDIKRVIIIVLICLAAALLITVIVFVVIRIVKKVKENKQENRRIEEENNRNRFEGADIKRSSKQNTALLNDSANDNPARGTETTLLYSPSENEGTTILSDSYNVYLGTLIRRKNGENIIINKDCFSIGKDSLNIDFRIADNSAISRRHATIRKSGNQIIIEDNNSTNGTFVKGEKLSKGQTKIINNGDVIKLADEEFDYRN